MNPRKILNYKLLFENNSSRENFIMTIICICDFLLLLYISR